MAIIERRHRLPRDCYKGKITAAFTLCLKENVKIFGNHEIVTKFVQILSMIEEKNDCIVLVYCFMPDHQHVILNGKSDDSDLWKAIVSYKQNTGFWFSKNEPTCRWQKDFYDHIIRKDENLKTQIKYLLDNPVRKGLVAYWQDYPFKGSIGCELEDVVNGII
jgi:putative transposase